MIFENDVKIEDVAEYFQGVINSNQLWMMPKHCQEFVFYLDSIEVCSVRADISPDDARVNAKNMSDVEYIFKKKREDAIKREVDLSGVRKRRKFRFGMGVGIAPPLSIRSRFGAR